MPSPSLLIALFVAFGLPATASVEGDWGWRLGQVALVFGSIGGAAACAGWLVARTPEPRRAVNAYFLHAPRFVDVALLIAYAWAIHGLGWASAIHARWDASRTILIDEGLILLPYLAGLLAGWSGLYWGEQALRRGLLVGRPPRLGSYLAARGRQTLALTLPLAALFALTHDVAARFWPGLLEDGPALMAGVVGVALVALAGMPTLVRFAWPSHPLPAGPLREDLEAIARRADLRLTDILVWDTKRRLVTAAVAGLLPQYRYIFLTDELLRQLDDAQIRGVFGHELGHLRHRHVLAFAGFFVASLGLVALMATGIDRWMLGPDRPWATLDETTRIGLTQVTTAAALGLYLYVVFGMLSRRFEREADMFACRVLSCDHEQCPPHEATEQAAPRDVICATAIDQFAGALATVAASNGLSPRRWMWRHGRIGDRIAFLLGLKGRPLVQRDEALELLKFRLSLGVVLGIAFIVAVVTGAFRELH